ncbi:MAG: hypothetical protein KGN39_10430 [Betaproteobacteria bacterium]|nr:hypothetical protein [Betaproteobacteria bacterium]
MKNSAVTPTDIDKQYLENLRNLHHKIAVVQQGQREISLALENIRRKIAAVRMEMVRPRLRPQPLG